MASGRRYHHGDLRAALLAASFDLLADGGLARFSVAAVARRLQVSSAAPYRHFPDRAHLLAAVSAAAAGDLGTAIEAAAVAAGPDPADRLAAAAGTYVRYVDRTGAGFPVIYAAELSRLPDEARRDRTRALMTALFDLALATGARSHQDAVLLVEATIAVAHGYLSLLVDGFFPRDPGHVEAVAVRATNAARALITSP